MHAIQGPGDLTLETDRNAEGRARAGNSKQREGGRELVHPASSLIGRGEDRAAAGSEADSRGRATDRGQSVVSFREVHGPGGTAVGSRENLPTAHGVAVVHARTT